MALPPDAPVAEVTPAPPPAPVLVPVVAKEVSPTGTPVVSVNLSPWISAFTALAALVAQLTPSYTVVGKIAGLIVGLGAAGGLVSAGWRK